VDLHCQSVVYTRKKSREFHTTTGESGVVRAVEWLSALHTCTVHGNRILAQPAVQFPSIDPPCYPWSTKLELNFGDLPDTNRTACDWRRDVQQSVEIYMYHRCLMLYLSALCSDLIATEA
jgi:hypothetical protein